MRFTLKKQKITTTSSPSPSSPPSSSLQQTMARRTIDAMLLSIKIVFINGLYIAVAGAVAAIFWIIFNIFDQLLFFSPVFVFYLPQDALAGFILSNITAILLGIVVSMNIYVLKHSDRSRISLTSFFSGSTIKCTFKHMRKLFFTGLPSCFHIWRSGCNSIYNSIQLPNTTSHSLNSTSDMGILFYKYQVN